MSIDFSGGVFYLFLILSLAGLVTAVFYTKDSLKGVLSKRSFFLLCGLRFLAIASLLFLFLEPLLQGSEKLFVEPKIVVLVDDSESIALAGFSKDSIRDVVDKLGNAIGENTQLKVELFSDQLRSYDSLSLAGKQTDVMEAVFSVQDKYDDGSLKSLILLSDGIVNKGGNSFKNNGLGVPVYVLGLGSDEQKKDVDLQSLYHNNTVVLGNEFLFRAEGLFKGISGSRIQVTTYFDNKEIYKDEISVVNNLQHFVLNHKLLADSVGLHQIRIVAKGFDNERLLGNNVLQSFIEVKLKKHRLVFVKDAPHPDVAALKSCFSENENYILEDIGFSALDQKITEADLLIVCGSPSSRQEVIRFQNNIKNYKKSLFFVSQAQADFSVFRDYGFEIKQKNQVYTSAQASVNNRFSFFNLLESERDYLQGCPPLKVVYGDYLLSTSYNTLLNQKIEGVSTDLPLLSFSQGFRNRIAWMSAEGLWKWKFHEIKQSEDGSFELFKSIINKSFSYLLSDDSDTEGRLVYDKVVNEGESVLVLYENFNRAGQLSVNDELMVFVEKNGGLPLVFEFPVEGNVYKKNFGTLSPGNYSLKVTGESNGIKKQINGNFVVSETNLEERNLTADFDLLKSISESTGGKFFTVDKIDELFNEIRAKKYKQESYFEIFTKKIIDELFLLSFLVVIILLEWFLRKWNGVV